MKNVLLKFFVAMTAVLFQSATAQQQMVIKIDGFRSITGQAMVFLFNNADDFPTKREKAFKSAKIPVSASSLIVTFDNVPEGTYGAAMYHDENSNGKMDRHWYGPPMEGYGASNDATGTIGPPKFSDAQFEFKNSQDTVKIIIHY